MRQHVVAGVARPRASAPVEAERPAEDVRAVRARRDHRVPAGRLRGDPPAVPPGREVARPAVLADPLQRGAVPGLQVELARRLVEPVRRPGVAHVTASVPEQVVPLGRASRDGAGARGDRDGRVVDEPTPGPGPGPGTAARDRSRRGCRRRCARGRSPGAPCPGAPRRAVRRRPRCAAAAGRRHRARRRRSGAATTGRTRLPWSRSRTASRSPTSSSVPPPAAASRAADSGRPSGEASSSS